MKKIFFLIKPIHKRFLIFGIINTLFGYFIGIVLYYLLFRTLGIIAVGIMANVISISFSFVMFKIFVFKTKNTNWIKEYLRGYIVYGIKAIVSILMLWACIEILKLNIFISQAIAILITTIITYTGHKKYTFKV